jgi:hypothetical protein
MQAIESIYGADPRYLGFRHAFLSYTCAVVPFQSNWTGVKAIRYTRAPSP